jgi:dTDP-glucose 4,6-dehydratase
MKLLVTGGCGFIGSNFVRFVLRERDDEVVNVDALTYAGNPENLSDLEPDPRYTFVRADVSDRAALEPVFTSGVDAVIHFAAESHVDRSIHDATPVVRTNVLGTQILLDLALRHGVSRYVQISTDEVYGSLGPDAAPSDEMARLQPNNPYSAAKAAGDLLARAYFRTHGLPVMITRCSNNFGPYQFPEKLIPLCVTNATEDRPLPLYGDGLNRREWLHVEDHCRAVDLVLRRGEPGEIYNIGGVNERPNIEIMRRILDLLDKPHDLIRHVADRPGHDRRYAIDAGRIRWELGWQPTIDFEEGMRQTVAWYTEHRTWWERVKSGQYREYYERQYGKSERPM